jgi:hypothetical protein
MTFRAISGVLGFSCNPMMRACAVAIVSAMQKTRGLKGVFEDLGGWHRFVFDTYETWGDSHAAICRQQWGEFWRLQVLCRRARGCACDNLVLPIVEWLETGESSRLHPAVSLALVFPKIDSVLKRIHVLGLIRSVQRLQKDHFNAVSVSLSASDVTCRVPPVGSQTPRQTEHRQSMAFINASAFGLSFARTQYTHQVPGPNMMLLLLCKSHHIDQDQVQCLFQIFSMLWL